MHDTVGVAVVNCLEQAAHVWLRLLLCEQLILLFADLFKERHSSDVLHDEVDELFVVVGLVVIDDIGVVELAQDWDFVHYIVQVVREFGFVEHFNGDFHVRVVFVVCLEHLAKGAHS